MDQIVDFRVRLPEEFRSERARDLPPEYRVQYDAVLGLDQKRSRTFEELLHDMDSAGVQRAVIHAEYEHGDPADELNEAVAQLVAKDPKRFSGVGTVTLEPLHPMRAVRQVEHVASLGLVGVNVQPSFFRLPIDERGLYPMYAKAIELGLMVGFHTGVNYSQRHPIRNDHPLQLDQVACDFPEGTFIACHAGWPWGAEMVAVARKHPNVYLEFGGLSPRYVAASGSGWEVVFRFMNSLLQRQILFATDWPVFDPVRAVEEWRGAKLKPHVLEALFAGNAQRLLNHT